MLKKSERIKRAGFSNRPLRRKRFRFGSIAFLTEPPRAAVVVSKKTCPKAVDRNRLKRRIYAILRGFIRQQKLHAGVIIYPTREALRTPSQELSQSIFDALQ